MRKILRFRLWKADEGVGAIEFGFVAPILLVLLLGIIDFGRAYWEQMQIATAADAGAQWAMSNGYNGSSIDTVAQSATNLANVGVSSSNSCGCPTSTGVSIYACSSTCPDGTTPKKYVIVNTHVCYSTLFKWPGLSYCSSGSSACSSCSSSQVALGAQSVIGN